MGIACSWSCCIDCFHRCSGPSLSSDRRPWCVGIGPAFAIIGVGNPAPLEALSRLDGAKPIAIPEDRRENVRLFDEVQARTRELSESLEQQTATSEVLQVISSSPGELEPVFQAMLANAVRICEADLGTMAVYEECRVRHVAFHVVPPT